MITISWSLTNYLAMKISNLFVSIVLFSVQSKLFYYFDRHDVMLTVANFCTKIFFFYHNGQKCNQFAIELASLVYCCMATATIPFNLCVYGRYSRFT